MVLGTFKTSAVQSDKCSENALTCVLQKWQGGKYCLLIDVLSIKVGYFLKQEFNKENKVCDSYFKNMTYKSEGRNKEFRQ